MTKSEGVVPNYPKILIVAISRVNKSDTSNNGLLLRSLFSGWPKEYMAQIFSGDGNGDEGYFGNYYQLSAPDRFLGKMFFKMKPNVTQKMSKPGENSKPAKINGIKNLLNYILVDTGIYELIFSVRLSSNLKNWVDAYKPDIIFAQGYNLTFTWLPIMLKKYTGAKLAFLTSDDWPTYLYSGMLGENKYLSKVPRFFVIRAVQKLMDKVDIPFAFGWAMANDYQVRYKREFFVISHCDDPKRFDNAIPKRVHPENVISIVTIGTFNKYRWPLLYELNEACTLLHKLGINVRVALFSNSIEPDGLKQLQLSTNIDIFPDPGSDQLPCFLKGGDFLFLPEGFDKDFVSAIKLSISSKAHLYMYSKKPIIILAHQDTGIAQYALKFNFAKVILNTNSEEIKDTLLTLINDLNMRDLLIGYGTAVANEFHNQDKVNTLFKKSLL